MRGGDHARHIGDLKSPWIGTHHQQEPRNDPDHQARERCPEAALGLFAEDAPGRKRIIRRLTRLAAAAAATAVLALLPLAATSASAASYPSLTQVHDPGHVTGTMHGRCSLRAHGKLPDPRCTPGSFDPAITRAKLCAPGYRTSSYRPPSSQTTRAKYQVVEPAYGQRNVRGELDHLVPLELGGSNDMKNFWVEAGKIPNPKDKVENQLHAMVCAGKISLHNAQLDIAHNWTTAP